MTVRLNVADWSMALEEAAKGYISEFESWGSKEHSVSLAKQMLEALRDDHATPGQLAVNRHDPEPTGQPTAYR